MSDEKLSRRQLLQSAIAGIAAVPAASLLAGTAGAEMISESDATAKSLGYVADAKATTNAAHKPGSACANCQFFQAGTSGCAIFVGFAVTPAGWCTAWAKKAA